MRHISCFAIALLLSIACLSLRAQNISSSPPSVNFGTLEVGESSDVTLTISTDSSASVVYSTQPPFSVSPGSGSPVSGEPDVITVSFSPTAPGTYNGTLAISDSDGVKVLKEVPLTGRVPARFSTIPTALQFGPVLVSSSADDTLRIRNQSSTPIRELSLVSTNPRAFRVEPANFTNVSPGSSAAATVIFTPNEPGFLRGAILVNGDGNSSSVSVEGEGVAFLLSSPAVDIGGVVRGCTGSDTLSVVTGAPFDFTVSPRDPRISASPNTFTTDASQLVTFTFMPEGAGSVDTTAVIFARANGQIVQQEEVPITAAGIGLVPVPAALEFGEIPAGGTSSVRQILVSTDPAAAVEIDITASSDNPAFQVTGVSNSRASVVFSPTQEGDASGVITLVISPVGDSSCSSTLEVPVSGVGAEALISLSPGSVDYGEVSLGGSATRSVTLENNSAGPFTGVASSNDPSFAVQPAGGIAQSGFTLAANGSASFDIVFQPASEGPASGQITFELTGGSSGSPVTVTRNLPVTGVGVEPSFSFVVVRQAASTPVATGDNLELPATAVGSTSSIEFEVQNESSNAATLAAITSSGGTFSLGGLPSLPATVGPDGSLRFDIVFEPASLGTFTGSLVVNEATFGLTGKSILASAQIIGLGATLPPGEQSSVGIQLSSPAPEEIIGTLSLEFSPGNDGLSQDPGLQFATGGQTVSFTIPNGSDTAVFSDGAAAAGFQPGTVFGTLTFSAVFESGGEDVTPAEPPSATAEVAATPPVITSVLAENVTPTGFTIIVNGLSTIRQVSGATFNFTPVSGVELNPSSVSPDVTAAFQTWFDAEESAGFGSMFTLEMPFTMGGEQSAVQSVSVTLSNSQGTSAPATVSLR